MSIRGPSPPRILQIHSLHQVGAVDKMVTQFLVGKTIPRGKLRENWLKNSPFSRNSGQAERKRPGWGEVTWTEGHKRSDGDRIT